MYLRPVLRCIGGHSTALRTPNLNTLNAFKRIPALSEVGLARFASTDPYNADASTSSQIYYGTLTPKIRAVKVFSLTTSGVGLAVQPMLIEQGTKMGGVPMVVFLCGFAGLFTFVTPLLLHFITKKYVTHIAYDSAKDVYQATTISFFLLKKQVCCIHF